MSLEELSVSVMRYLKANVVFTKLRICAPRRIVVRGRTDFFKAELVSVSVETNIQEKAKLVNVNVRTAQLLALKLSWLLMDLCGQVTYAKTQFPPSAGCHWLVSLT